MIDQEPFCDDLCDDGQLLRMLRSDSDSCDSGEMLDHVEKCERCQHRLDELAADESEWRKTVEVLSSHSCEGTADEHMSHIQPRQGAWTESMARQLLSPPSHPELLGRIGRYDVERLIGSGGMGVVFKAYDTELNRPVAVKLLAPYLASSGAARNRFAREARAAAAVVDEHVVAIHNVESDGEHPFLVMKYIAGGSLQMRLDREGPLEVCEVLRIGMQTANGLAAAHAQGLIHRDVKPSNILLDEGVERALLTDFGLARATDDASLTRSGFHPGTPHYMSPEQVRGEAIDARSDLFGLGCVLYALCTGHPPFRSETSYAVLRRIIDDTPRSIREANPNIPPWLEQVVIKLLAKSPDDRFESAEQVAELLEGCLAHVQQPTTTPLPESVAALAPQQIRRPPIGKFIAAAALAFSLIFAGVFIVLALNNSTLAIVTDAEETDGNVLWRATLGSQTMRAPVVHGDHVYIGTNNDHGYIPRYPSSVDLGVLLCFQKSDGKFLWQHSNEKLPTGRVHDWPLQGITSRPCVEGERLWYVTNRGEIVCLDTMGFRDGQNDGPVKDEASTDFSEADVVWRLNMLAKLGVRPHNMSTCTVAVWQDRVFAVTGNGVDETHLPPLANAPSFIAVDKATGRLLWQDDSPGQNVLHGQWGSPVVADLAGRTQVIFPGGDGWLYSYDPQGTPDGTGKLNWKFDCNPKESVWKLGGQGTRNNLLHAPTVHDGLLYIAMGQDPEHGSGPGRVWCIDPSGTGDVSPELVFNKSDPEAPIAHKRVQACVAEEGDFTVANPDSKVVWQFPQQGVNGNEKFEIEEQMSRSLSTIAIEDDLLFVSDVEGILHCLDRATGKQHWGFDMFAQTYSTPLIVGNEVYLGNIDGEICVFGCSADPGIAMPDGEPIRRIEFETSVFGSVVMDNAALFIATKNELIAMRHDASADKPADQVQVIFQQPPGAKAVLGKSEDEEIVFPKRVNLSAGETHQFTLTNIPNDQGMHLSGSIELALLNKHSRAYLEHNAIPIQITSDDIDHCASHNLVVKVIYLPIADYANPVLGAPETLASNRLDPGVNPIDEARRRGELFAVLRLRKRITYDGQKRVDVDGSDSFGADSSGAGDAIQKSFQRKLLLSDRAKQVFALAEDSARENGRPLNLLFLLAAVLQNRGSGAEIAVREILDQKELPMKDLIRRCEVAARAADANTATEWTRVVNAAESTANGWKHNHIATEQLLMALMADGTESNQFLSEQGIEAAAVSDMLNRILFSPGPQPVAVPIR